MFATWTITRRELTAYFYSPIAYILMGVFGSLALMLLMIIGFQPSSAATTKELFDIAFILLVFFAPALSMRLLSEEFGRGTIETLMTSPLSDTQVVLGKFAGAMAFLAALLLTLLVPVGLIEYYGNPEYLPILSGLLGLLLVGALFLAIGLFASSLTRDQVSAFILGFFIVTAFALPYVFRYQIGTLGLHKNLTKALYYVGAYGHFEGLNQGYFSLGNILYFVSGTAMFVFLAVKIVESRRWR